MPVRPTSPIRLAWRWLLRLDEPSLTRTDAELEAEMFRNYRWNFTVNLLDVTTFWFGNSFISAATILPLFISKLTDSEFPLALLAVFAQSAWFFPQLFTANAIEGLDRQKPVIVNLGLFLERLPMVLLIVAALISVRWPLLALILFFIGFATHGLGAGAVAPAWQELLARIFPVDRRGRFFGTALALGGGTAAVGAFFSTWILGRFPFPTNFVYLFSIATAGILMSWGWLALCREPVRRVEAPRQSQRQFWASLPNIIRQDHNFRRFLIARGLLALGGMGVGFVTVAAVERWQISDGVAGLYTAAFLIGQTLTTLAFGFIADRFGHKFILELSALGLCVAFTVAWLATAAGWYYLVFALIGANAGSIIVSGVLVVLEFCRPERRPTYVGIANTVIGAVGIMAPLLGGLLAGFSYNWLFALSALISLLALITMRWGCASRVGPAWSVGQRLNLCLNKVRRVYNLSQNR